MNYKVKLTLTEPILGTVPKDPEVYATYIAGRAKPELSADALAEEIGTVPVSEEKGWTGFHTLPSGTPFLYDYVIKGFFKDACGMLRRVPGTISKSIRAYKKIIDGLVFIRPRKIPLVLPTLMLVPIYKEVENPSYDPDAVDWTLYEKKETELEENPFAWADFEEEWRQRYRLLLRKTIRKQVGVEKQPGSMGVLERPLRAQTAQGERVALARSDTCPIGTTIEFELTTLGVVDQDLLHEWFNYGSLRGLGQWRNASWGRFEYELTKQ